jgi:drug/metabolite transporter (DMT)-like permease
VALLGVAILTGILQWTPQGIGMAPDAWQAWRMGDTLTTLGAIFFTGQILAIDHFARRADSSGFTAGMFAALIAFGTVTFLMVLPWTPESSADRWILLLKKPEFITTLIFLGTFCSFLSFYGMNKYQPYVTAVQASVIYSLEPVFASSWALFLPGWISIATGLVYENERWSVPMVAGGGLILLANVVALWPKRMR